MRTRIIAIANAKGGTAKTTTSLALATLFAAANYRVLLVDCDAQAQATWAIGIERGLGIYNLTATGQPLRELSMPTGRPNLDIVPGGAATKQAREILAGRRLRETILGTALEPARALYDFVFIDSSPAADVMLDNVIVAADEFVIPTGASMMSLDGVTQFIASVQELAHLTRAEKLLSAIVPVSFDIRTNEARENLIALRNKFGQAVAAPVPIDTKVVESVAFRKSIYEYAPDSRASIAYIALMQKIQSKSDGIIIDG